MEQQQQLRNEITRLKEDLDQRNVTIEEQRVALEEAKQQIATLETSVRNHSSSLLPPPLKTHVVWLHLMANTALCKPSRTCNCYTVA